MLAAVSGSPRSIPGAGRAVGRGAGDARRTASAAATPASSSATRYTGSWLHFTVPPAICWTSIGPTVRAGLIDAPVAGATGMIAANTTRPIATPANPAAALRWITPKIVNTRMNVPTNSAVNACTQLMSPYDATPSPTSLAFLPSTPMMAAAPRIAPTTWAPM